MVTFTHTKMRLIKNLFYFQFESIIFNIFVESLFSVKNIKQFLRIFRGIAEKVPLNDRFHGTLTIDMTKKGGGLRQRKMLTNS